MSPDRQALAAGAGVLLTAAALGAMLLFEAAWLQPGDRAWMSWFGYALWYGAPLACGVSWGYLKRTRSAFLLLALVALAAAVSGCLNMLGFTIGVMAVPRINNVWLVLGMAVISFGILVWVGAAFGAAMRRRVAA